MNEPKRHHIVPQLILDRFAVDDQVEVLSRSDLGKRFVTSVENALVERHYYSIDTGAGKDTGVESMLANLIESPAARAIRRIVDDGASTFLPGLRSDISTFLAFQKVRGPATRDASVNALKADFRKVQSLLTPEMIRAHLRKESGREPTDEEVQELVDFDTTSLDVGVSSEANLHLGNALPTALELVPSFYRRRWLILEFDAPVLVTGDEPIALIGESLKPGEALGLAIAPEVVFSTDPRHALVMIRPDRAAADGRQKGDARMAEIINRHVAFTCHRYIVQSPGTDPLKGINLARKAPSVRVQSDYIIWQQGRSLAEAKSFRVPRTS